MYAIFYLNNQEFAININKVRESINFEAEIIKIPNSIDIVKGVINIRNEIIPIINLKKRFGETNLSYTEDCKIAIVSYKSTFIGLLFDDISEVLEIEEKNIKSTESNSIKKSKDVYKFRFHLYYPRKKR